MTEELLEGLHIAKAGPSHPAILPAILTIEAPQAHRAVGAIPAVYLLMGEGFQYVLAIATEGARRARFILVAALLLAASVAAASQDVWGYFRIQVVHPLA